MLIRLGTTLGSIL